MSVPDCQMSNKLSLSKYRSWRDNRSVIVNSDGVSFKSCGTLSLEYPAKPLIRCYMVMGIVTLTTIDWSLINSKALNISASFLSRDRRLRNSIDWGIRSSLIVVNFVWNCLCTERTIRAIEIVEKNGSVGSSIIGSFNKKIISASQLIVSLSSN